MEFEELYEIAKNTINPWQHSKHTWTGKIGAALLTEDGNVYTGVSIDTPCSLGFCAEGNAIGSMLTAGESRIAKIVAVSYSHGIVAPCGRCREFIYQINHKNLDCQVLLKERVATLDELLPDRWK